MREHSFEAGCFTISVSGILNEEDIPDNWQHLLDSDHFQIDWACGGSCIADPLGNFVVEPVFDEKTIIYHSCMPQKKNMMKAFFDQMGHYSRYDVARLEVNEEPLEPYVSAPSPRRPRPTRLEEAIDDLEEFAGEFDVTVEELKQITQKLEAEKKNSSTKSGSDKN